MTEKKTTNGWPGYDSLLLPLGHKADVNNLTNLASLVVNRKEGEIEFLHVIKEGSYSQLPHEWRVGSKRVTESHHTMMKKGIHSSKKIVTAGTIEEGILQEAEDITADAIIMGWGPKPKSSLSALISHIMSRADCDVIIFKTRGNPENVKEIIYPLAIKPNISRLRLIGRYIKGTGSRLTFAHITDGSTESEDRGEKLLNNALADAGQLDIEADTLLVSSKNVIKKIAEISPDYDLMILGPSGGWWLKKTLFGHKTDKIASKVDCSVLLHKASED